MKGSGIRTLRDVVERQMCCGCGACAFVAEEAVEMEDVLDHGRRPLIANDKADSVEVALAICPGVNLERGVSPTGVIPELYDDWGPVLEMWEGHAGDEEIRFMASSGGAATALALHGLEELGMHGVVHITARQDIAYLNETVVSKTRGELLAATGSRYAPASPCDKLGDIVDAAGPHVFIGKPCDVAAIANIRKKDPASVSNVGLTIAIFCAGTPSTRGTLEMIKHLGVDPQAARSIRYRGKGWPGKAEVQYDTGDESVASESLSYEASWGEILQKHRQWRCYICPDHTGEFADIAVGDPWYREVKEGEPGESLVLARTPLGRQVVQSAMAARRLTLRQASPSKLPASQPNLLRARGAAWGRARMASLMGGAAPRFTNIRLFRTWCKHLTVKQRVQSLLGTGKRVFRRRLDKRIEMEYLDGSELSTQVGKASSKPRRSTNS